MTNYLRNDKDNVQNEVAHHEFLFGGLAYTTSVITLFPYYKTIFFQQLDGIHWNQAINRLKDEGFRLAYRGVLPPLLQRGSSGAVMFGVQSISERTLLQNPVSQNWSPATNIVLSSIFAGFCEVPLMPFERIQTLLQNNRCFPSYRNTFQTFASLVKEHGVPELYRGVTPVIWRNSIANAVYFGGHKWLNDLRWHSTNEGPLKRSMWNLAFGAFLGGFISCFTFPINVMKTRMQSCVGGEFEGLFSTFLNLLYHKNESPDVYRLYRGFPANLIRGILSWGIITMTYHYFLDMYSDSAS